MEYDFFGEENYGDEANYEMEAKAFERAGPSGVLAELLTSVNIEKKGRREALPPEDRFLIAVDALSRRINEERLASLSQADIDNMLMKTVNIPNLRYKSPLGYILGYLASRGGTVLDVKNVRNILENVLPSVSQDGGVEPPDVIRYARFWMNLA